MMKTLTIFSTLILLLISASAIRAQNKFEKEVVDSAIVDQNFAFVINDVTATSGKYKGGTGQQMIWYCKGQPSMYTIAKSIKLHNFNDGKNDSIPLYAKDINGDKFKEIIIFGRTGEGTCCNHLAFHTLQDSLIVDLGVFNLKDLKDYQLKDLDGDSIPEVIFPDPNYVKWHTSFSNSPAPLLIWKWNKDKYKAANYKFSDYLLKQITDDDYKKLEKAIKIRMEKEYDPKDEIYKYPPPELWGLALDYIYAGKTDKAKAMFDKYWPKKIPGRDKFYAELQDKVKSSEFWEELSKSDW